MGCWLVKSDPDEYGWPDLEADKETEWTGVKNYAARLHLNNMKKGDGVLFYHSGAEMAVVGEAIVSRESFSDPTTDDDRWVAIGLRAVKAFRRPVELKRIKAERQLQLIGLVRIGRLSVMPLKKAEYDLIMQMGA